ncbi:MAG: hypothetical protein ACRDZM_03600 [Acidimicrobiia bacterium]
MKVSPASATPLAAALIWVVGLIVDPGPLARRSVLLVGVGLLAMATVSLVGMLIVGGRWARNTAFAVVGLTAVIAAVRPIDAIWVVALISSAIACVALLSNSVSGMIRKLPAAGPPPRAVLVPMALLGFPFLIGLGAWDEPTTATMIVGLSSPVAALWYSRVLPGGLLVARVLWPGIAIGLAAAQGLVPGVVSAAVGALVAALAWHPTVKLAYHPPREVGTSYPIPPELAPREVLDTARLDERGKPRS